jgi:uncharacterized protein (TIGR03083 family)
MTTAAPSLAPRRSRLDRSTANALAVETNRRIADDVAALDPHDWTRPTDCTEWNVRQLVAHVIGQALMMSTPLESMRQLRQAKKRHEPGTELVHALTAAQVERFIDRSPSEMARLVAEAGVRGARGRRRLPGFVRSRIADRPTVNGVAEPWTMGYVVETILTRDPWMHRIDLARATGRDLLLTPDVDGVIVDDVVHEWAERHGLPYRLTLTGPAGGSWSSGPGGEEIELGAVEFCRVLSGRGSGQGLLSTEVPF